jgi:hypothetical protein
VNAGMFMGIGSWLCHLHEWAEIVVICIWLSLAQSCSYRPRSVNQRKGIRWHPI